MRIGSKSLLLFIELVDIASGGGVNRHHFFWLKLAITAMLRLNKG